MDFKSTSIKLHHGYTLVELLMTMGVSSIVLLFVLIMFICHTRSLAAISNYITMQKENQNAKDILSKTIRRVDHLTAYSSTNLTFLDYDNNTLQLNYSPLEKTLWLSKTGATTILLRNCSSLQFQIFRRTVQTNALDAATAADLGSCKVVQVTWTSTRSINCFTNTENLQCAKIVIRKN